jgi:anti-anti-sigma factor
MVQLTRQHDVTVVELGPHYDSLEEGALEELGDVLLTNATLVEPPLLVLDLSQTSVIGSRFIELLVRAWKRLSERGGGLALCGLQPFSSEVLRVTRLDTLWESFSDRESAVAALARGDATKAEGGGRKAEDGTKNAE